MSGNRQGRTWGSKGVHTRPVSLQIDVWDCLGSQLPDMEPFHPSDAAYAHPHPPIPLDLDSPSPGPPRFIPDNLGSKADTAATHQTRFESPVSI